MQMQEMKKKDVNIIRGHKMRRGAVSEFYYCPTDECSKQHVRRITATFLDNIKNECLKANLL